LHPIQILPYNKEEKVRLPIQGGFLSNLFHNNRLASLIIFLGLTLSILKAQPEVGTEMRGADLQKVSLKRLMDLDVTSVSKRSQKLQDVATSIYVINAEDIRRSGATRIQDVLKLVPGAWFSEISYSLTSNAIREGASTFAGTLLWILDGVPIINPILGGILLNTLDFPLEDIARIEVIKGPGGTIYGANAATGIISIYTKSGEAAEGIKVAISGGTQEYYAPYVRYGFEAKNDLFLTFWGRYKSHEGYDRNPLFTGDTVSAPIYVPAINDRVESPIANRFTGKDDNQKALTGGIKWDYLANEDWTWSGKISQGHVTNGQYSIHLSPYLTERPADPKTPPKQPDLINAKEEIMDQNIVQSRLDITLSNDHSLFINGYNWYYRNQVALSSGATMGYNISELEIQDNLLVLGHHRLSSGTNLRRVQYLYDNLDPTGSIFIQDPEYLAFLFGAFFQDEMTLGRYFTFTAGIKTETWSPQGLIPEISPSFRVAFKPTESQTWWAAVSRSLTTPTNTQRDVEQRVGQLPPAWTNLIPSLPAIAAGKYMALVPGGKVKPVEYYTFELGHRGMQGQQFQWDINSYYSFVRDQAGLTPIDPTFSTLIVSKAHAPDSIIPLNYANLSNYEIFGSESIFRYYPSEILRLELSYSLFWMYHFEGLAIPNDPNGRIYQKPFNFLTNTPRHVGRAKVYLSLPWQTEATTNACISSPFNRGEAFNYFLQLPSSQTPQPEQSIIADPARIQFQLDLSFRKLFLNDQLSLSIWGRNLLADPFVEVFNQYGWISYPHQIHRTFGGDLSYNY
jgi:iron complex outermembrane recepter protein